MIWKRSLAVAFLLALSLQLLMADNREKLQQYFNDMAARVKTEQSPSAKREIMNSTFTHVLSAIDLVKQSPGVSSSDVQGIAQFRKHVAEKQDELNGSNGMQRVTDQKLNAFADYSVQDIEQADQYVTISVVTLLLIIILVVLLAR